MSVRILLFAIAIILFAYAGYRMRTQKGMSITEITVRALTLIIFFAVMFLADQFLNDDDSIIVILIDLSVFELGYGLHYVHEIKTLKSKFRSLEDD